MDCTAYETLAAAHSDGQLDPAEQAAADEHTAGCWRCAGLRRAQETVAAVLRQHRTIRPASPELRDRIQSALADAAAVHAGTARTRWRTRVILAGAIAVGLALVFLPRLLSRPVLLTALAHDVRAANAGEIPFDMRSSDVAQLGAFYHTRLDLTDPLADLGGADFRLVGGAVAAFDRTSTTLTVYEGPGGKIICRRFRVGTVPLPAGGQEIDGARYFEVDGVTVRIQQVGDMICCMASTLPRDALVQLFSVPAVQHN